MRTSLVLALALTACGGELAPDETIVALPIDATLTTSAPTSTPIATPTPTATPAPVVIVGAGAVNVRSGPGTDHERVC